MISLEKIKNRKIGQWAAAYAAAAWLLLQVTQILSQVYSWPPVILRVLPILLAVGFIAALIIAWYHGEKGQQRVSAVELVMLTALLIMAGGAMFAARRTSQKAGVAERQPVSSGAPSPASIAVLPFQNFSSDREQDYFSDGITEEILNVLAQLQGLEVAARTSSFSFKDKNLPIPEIGQKLNVAHVLEGSVRKSGDMLRITAQLVNARTGFHVWSKTYDRAATDVFAVQDEIARSIGEALQIALQPRRAAATTQVNAAAHDEYLLGLFYWNKRTAHDLLVALVHFRRAVQLQADYAAAWAGIANTWNVIPVYVDSIPGTRALKEARAAAKRAREIDPDLPEALTANAMVLANLDYDWKAADALYERALELNPSYATALQWQGESFYGRDPAKAVSVLKAATAADPLSRVIWLQLGNAYLNVEQLDLALAAYENAVALDSTWLNPYRNLVYVYLAKRDSTGALQTVARARKNTGQPFAFEELFARAAFNPALRPQASRMAGHEPNPVRRAFALGFIGDWEGALLAFETAIATRHTDETRLVYFPGLKPLRHDPRFIAAVKRMKL